jgi:hypothetical protein
LFSHLPAGSNYQNTPETTLTLKQEVPDAGSCLGGLSVVYDILEAGVLFEEILKLTTELCMVLALTGEIEISEEKRGSSVTPQITELPTCCKNIFKYRNCFNI